MDNFECSENGKKNKNLYSIKTRSDGGCCGTDRNRRAALHLLGRDPLDRGDDPNPERLYWAVQRTRSGHFVLQCALDGPYPGPVPFRRYTNTGAGKSARVGSVCL